MAASADFSVGSSVGASVTPVSSAAFVSFAAWVASVTWGASVVSVMAGSSVTSSIGSTLGKRSSVSSSALSLGRVFSSRKVAGTPKRSMVWAVVLPELVRK